MLILTAFIFFYCSSGGGGGGGEIAIPYDNDDDDEFFLRNAEWLTDEKRLQLITSRDHCQRFSLSQISEFEPAQNQSSDFVE